jgi:hypothetical protein
VCPPPGNARLDAGAVGWQFVGDMNKTRRLHTLLLSCPIL